jgi:arylsulfatase A-like enzyme
MVDHLHSGDEIELTVTTPPQVARHEGYETAFLNMDTMTFTVP